jgi:mRNA interferase MazF
MQRGDIYIADLDPTVGSEIRKTRPVVIFQNNYANKVAQTVTVLPISSAKYKGRVFEVELKKNIYVQLRKDSKIILHHIRSIDKSRISKKIGHISEDVIKEVEKKLMLHLGVIA